MGIFSRLGTLIKSNINDLITKAEDPEKMLSQVLLEMQQQLVEAKKAVAVAIADEKKLQKQYTAETDKSKEWERKAMVAVRAGDDNLARQALARKQEHETIAQQFQQQWISQKQAVEKLKDALRLLNNKIEEAKRKKNILIARKKRAEAQQQIANTMQGLGDTSAFDTFDRMAERIQLMEAEAEAGAELAGELSGDTLESKFLQLEQGPGGGEDEALNELKAKMGLLEAPKGETAKQLGAGAAAGKDDDGHGKKDQSGPVGPSLTAEDLKELEDLDLSELEKEKPKAG
ncbi:MAG TPA: PspA/IM30 family protein [Kofleriaceae bacterium]|nr:PspA/IM30 family protein [Kofleriaceae bacterium]